MTVQENSNNAGSGSLETASTDNLATVTRRFWTFVIDWIATRVIILTAGITYASFFGIEAIETIGFWEDVLLSSLIYIIYYIALESLFGRTLGKALLGTLVVNLDGSRPGMSSIVTRTLSRLIPFEPLSFTLADTWWHDSLSRTKVVRSGGAS